MRSTLFQIFEALVFYLTLPYLGDVPFSYVQQKSCYHEGLLIGLFVGQPRQVTHHYWP